MGTPHAIAAPSPWVLRWAHLVPAGASVLDVACGRGRHARWFAGRGCTVDAVDRDPEAQAALAGSGVRFTLADIEGGPWPYAGRRFDAIVVTNYLHRPLFPQLLAALAPRGLLIYETFAAGNAAFGKPSNPAFLLAAGELLALANGLHVLGYEDGIVARPAPARVQRLCALALEDGEPAAADPALQARLQLAP